MTTNTETLLTKNFESGQQAFYGADAGIERTIQDLMREASWSTVLAGSSQSGFVDQPPYMLPDGTSADLTAMTTAYGPRPMVRVEAVGRSRPRLNVRP